MSEKVNIALVICGSENKVDDALVTIKSAILFGGTHQIHFLLVCQDHLKKKLYSQVGILIMIHNFW